MFEAVESTNEISARMHTFMTFNYIMLQNNNQVREQNVNGQIPEPTTILNNKS